MSFFSRWGVEPPTASVRQTGCDFCLSLSEHQEERPQRAGEVSCSRRFASSSSRCESRWSRSSTRSAADDTRRSAQHRWGAHIRGVYDSHWWVWLIQGSSLLGTLLDIGDSVPAAAPPTQDLWGDFTAAGSGSVWRLFRRSDRPSAGVSLSDVCSTGPHRTRARSGCSSSVPWCF